MISGEIYHVYRITGKADSDGWRHEDVIITCNMLHACCMQAILSTRCILSALQASASKIKNIADE